MKGKRMPVHIEAAQLDFALKRVAHAVAKDEARPVLTCVSLEPRGDLLIRLVAADNYRVAIADVPIPDGPLPAGGLIPRHHLPALRGFLRAHRGELALVVADGRLGLSDDRGQLSVDLLDGQFPTVDDVLPVNPTDGYRRIAVNRQFLADLRHADSEESAGILRVWIKGALDPILVQAGEDYREVIMPVRIP